MKKKEKKIEKNEQGISKPKWRLWMTICSVILGVGLIVGATILGVVLARGGWDEKPIEPVDIFFDVNNEDYINLYNSETQQIEATENFTLVLTSSTLDANQKEVTLAFEGNYKYSSDKKYIDNGIIKVPATVNLFESFTVELLTEHLKDEFNNEILNSQNEPIDWIVGGISTLIAKREQLTQQKLKIAVDVPVYKTETIILNKDEVETNKIVIGDIFTIQTKFIPAKSEYMFSDVTYEEVDGEYQWVENVSSESIRKKLSFYQSSSSYVKPVYDSSNEMHFVAGDEIVNNVTLNSYTFKNSALQLLTEKKLKDLGLTGENYYTQMIEEIAGSGEGNYKFSNTKINIGTADVDSFEIGAGNKMTINQNETTRLNMTNQNDGKLYLDARIFNSNRDEIPNMLSNVAINFSFENSEGLIIDPTLDGGFLQVVGGTVSEINGKVYYRPNSSEISDKKYSYWNLLAKQTGKVTMNVALIVETENGQLGLYEKNGQPQIWTIDITIEQHIEEDISWSGIEKHDILLNFDNDGSIFPETLNLKDYMFIPEQNTYKDTILLAYFADGYDAKSILGEGGFDAEHSGKYIVNGEELYLYAIQGTNLTVYNTGILDLYFATIVTQDGLPVVEESGIYKISKISNSIEIDIKKELNDSSVIGASVDMGNFETFGDTEIYYIDKGNEGTFKISFNVAKDSLAVFETLLSKMTLKLYDNSSKLIGTISQSLSEGNFILIGTDFSIDQETGLGIFTFELQLSQTSEIKEEMGVIVQSFTLTYNNDDKEIVWGGSNGYNITQILEGKLLTIYSPITKSITLENYESNEYLSYINGTNEIIVEQSIDTNSGNVTLSIKLGDEEINATQGQDSITTLLYKLFGQNFSNIIVKDQIGKTNTLKNMWKFNLFAGSDSVVAIENKQILFKTGNNDSVVIDIISNDLNYQTGNSQIQVIKLNFKVTSIGITKAEYTTSKKLGEESYTETENITSLSVTKYGAKSETQILLNSLIRLYVGENVCSENVYNFKLSAGYLEGLSSTTIIDLFGENGMLTVLNSEGNPISVGNDSNSIKTILLSSKISGFKINKNFYKTHQMQIMITDKDSLGVINTTLTLTLEPNITINGKTSYGSDNNEKLYAGSDVIIENKVNNNNEGTNISFANLYSAGTKYLVGSSGVYKLSDSQNNAVGKIVFTNDSATVQFYDFWDKETNEFKIEFTPDGNNEFTIKFNLSFKIYRDLDTENIATENNTYYILGGSGDSNQISKWSDIVQFNRLSDGNPVDSVEFQAYFEKFLTIGNEGIVNLDSTNNFLFGYNEKSYATKLIIKYNEIEIGSTDVYIELYNTGTEQSIYDYIANKISLTKSINDEEFNIHAKTQIVGNIEYIMMVYETITYNLNASDANSGNGFDEGNNYNMYIRQSNLENSSLSSYYTSSINSLKLKAQTDVLAGLGNENAYLVLYFNPKGSGDAFANAKATMYVPIIISSIGYEFVKYDNSDIPENKTLEIALTDPSELLKSGIYNTISAGQATQLINDVSYYLESGLNSVSGLLKPEKDGANFTTTISYYPTVTLISQETEDGNVQNLNLGTTSSNIIKLIDSSNGRIDLNHLSTEITDFYLGLKYTINLNGRYRDFYYLVKVTPDVKVNESVYGFLEYGETGGQEHISVEKNTQAQIDWDEVYDDTTINSGYKRFNISKIYSESDKSFVVDVTNDSTVSLAFKIWGNYTIGEEVKQLIGVDVIVKLTKDSFISLENSSYINGSITIKGQEINGDTIISKSLISCIQDIYEGTVSITNFELIVQSGSCYIYDVTETLTTQDEVDNYIRNNSSSTGINNAIFANLVSNNSIVSVKVGNNPEYTTQEQWGNDIIIESLLENNVLDGSILKFTPLVNEKIIITLKHTYESDNSLDSRLKRAVIGGEQYYTIVINDTDTKNYSVRFTNGSEVKNISGGTFEWNLENAILESDNRIKSIKVQLIDNAQAGHETTTGTIIYDKLQIQLVSGIKGIDFESFSYDWSQSAGGLFKLTLCDYISKDTLIEFAVFTEYGYLATLKVNIKANASYEEVKDGNVLVKTTLYGGNVIDFSSIYSIKLNNTENNNYTVTANISSENKLDDKFVKFENNQFIVADLVSSKTIHFDYTITFTDSGYKFTFSDTLTFKANITASAITGNSSLAGVRYNLIENNNNTKLYKNANQGNDVSSDITNITYFGSTNSPAVDNSQGIMAGYNTDTIIKLNDISSDSTSVEIEVRIRFTFSASSEVNKPYEEIVLRYSFTVYKAVTLDVNYPIPDDEELDREYVDDGSYFADVIDDFINNNSIYNKDNRFVAYDNELNGTNGVITNYTDKIDSSYFTSDTISIVVKDIQNATIWAYDGTNFGLNPDGANPTPYSISSGLDLTKGIYLRLGTYIGSSSKDITKQNTYKTDGNKSIITFEITYRKATITYTVEILSNIFGVQLAYTKYSSSGQLTDNTTVTYETIYVDKTNTTDIFAGDRMFKVSMNSSLSNEGNYYIVFKDAKNKFYASYPQYISSEDQAKELYLDLGYSMYGKEYYGTYLTSAIESLGYGVYENGLMQYYSEETKTQENVTEDMMKEVANADENNQIFTSKSLVSRVQLTYGGNNVNYKYFKDSLIKNNNTTYDVSTEKKHTINIITSVNPLNPITVDNGATIKITSSTTDVSTENETTSTIGYQKTFSANYYFMPRIDIEVENAFTGANNYIELEVNKEYLSIVTLLGIKHPTNDTYVSKTDFGKDKAELRFEVITYDNDSGSATVDDETMKNYLNSFMTLNNISEFKRYASTETNTYEYLSYSGLLNASQSNYDYSLLPLGAKNDGDFVLGKITYSSTSGGYTETYYVIFKIMPDYIVKFGDTTEGNSTTGGVISNINKPYTISSLTTSENKTYYSNFKLTSTDKVNDTGYLSIKHKNGNNQSVELSTSNFTISLEENLPINGITINNSTNISQKFNNAFDDKWTTSTQTNKTIRKYTSKTDALTFSNVKEVIFGTQYYMIEGVDVYGYTYQLYFNLQSRYSVPSIAESSQNITLTEGKYFDFGAVYDKLTIEKGDDKYHISIDTITQISQNDEVALINISGIEAYLFAYDYTNSTDASKYYLDKTEEGEVKYKPVVIKGGDSPRDDTGLWDDETKEYFKLPTLQYITVSNVQFYSVDEEGNADTKLEDGIRQDDKTNNYTLATCSSQEGFFEGLNIRAPFSNGQGTSSDNEENTSGLKPFQVPRFEGDVFGNSNTTEMIMSVTLKYKKDAIEEYIDLQLKVTVVREITIEEKATVAVDGQAISIKDAYNITTSANDTSVDRDNISFVNDTLEVLINSASQASFTLNLTRSGKVIKTKNISRTNSSSFAKTEYISLSEQFGINVQAGDKVTISNEKNAKFYYITSSDTKGNISNNSFTISEIENDYVYVENAQLLKTNKYYNVTKHYIVNVRLSSNEILSDEKITTLTLKDKKFTYNKENKQISFEGLSDGNYYFLFKVDDVIYAIEKQVANSVTSIDLTSDSDFLSILDGSENVETYGIIAISDNQNIYLSDDNKLYEISNNSYSYKISHNYTVTGYYYNIKGVNTDEIVRKLVAIKESNDLITNFDAWYRTVFSYYQARIENGKIAETKIENQDNININYFWFTIEKDDSGNNGSGNITLNNDYSKLLANETSYGYGKISYLSHYTYDQYIKMILRVVVSGVDRDINKIEGDVSSENNSFEIAIVNIGWDIDYRNQSQT